MSAGSVLGVKMVALEVARAKGRTHSVVEAEGGEKRVLDQQPSPSRPQASHIQLT